MGRPEERKCFASSKGKGTMGFAEVVPVCRISMYIAVAMEPDINPATLRLFNRDRLRLAGEQVPLASAWDSAEGVGPSSGG